MEILWESAGGRFRHTLSQPKERKRGEELEKNNDIGLPRGVKSSCEISTINTPEWPIIELSCKIKQKQNLLLKYAGTFELLF